MFVAAKFWTKTFSASSRNDKFGFLNAGGRKFHTRELHGITDRGNPAVTAVMRNRFSLLYRGSSGNRDSYLAISIDYRGNGDKFGSIHLLCFSQP